MVAGDLGRPSCVQQLMSRHGSLLWRAGWSVACSRQRGRPKPGAVTCSHARASPARCRSEAISADVAANNQTGAARIYRRGRNGDLVIAMTAARCRSGRRGGPVSPRSDRLSGRAAGYPNWGGSRDLAFAIFSGAVWDSSECRRSAQAICDPREKSTGRSRGSRSPETEFVPVRPARMRARAMSDALDRDTAALEALLGDVLEEQEGRAFRDRVFWLRD